MKTFTLRLIRTTGFVSSAIAFVEGAGAIADHAEALNRAGDGWIGAHAGVGVANMPLDWAEGIVWERRYSIEMTDEQYERAMTFLESRIGMPYDYSDILGIFFHELNLDNPHRIICSVLQFEALDAAGIKLLKIEKGEEHLVTPANLDLSPTLIDKCSYRYPLAA